MVTALRLTAAAGVTALDCLARARRGDPDAFATLVEDFGPAIYNFVVRLAGDPDDAHDIVQDVWTRVARHLDQLDDDAHFRPWLYRIARNCAMDFLAKRPRHARAAHTDDDGDSAEERIADTDAYQPESNVVSLDERRKVWEALGRLSEVDRTVLFLRESQELPYAQIAQVLNITRNAAEARVCRAREHFRREFVAVDHAASTCHTSPLHLSAWVDGELRGVARAILERHLEGCTDCTRRLAAIQTGRSLYRGIGFLLVPEGTVAAILARLSTWFGPGAPAVATAAATGTAVASAGGGLLGQLTGAAAVKIAGVVLTASVATGAGASVAPAILVPAQSHSAPIEAPASRPASTSPVVSPAATPASTSSSRAAAAPGSVATPADPGNDTALPVSPAPTVAVPGAAATQAPAARPAPSTLLAAAAPPVAAPPPVPAAEANRQAPPDPARTLGDALRSELASALTGKPGAGSSVAGAAGAAAPGTATRPPGDDLRNALRDQITSSVTATLQGIATSAPAGSTGVAATTGSPSPASAVTSMGATSTAASSAAGRMAEAQARVDGIGATVSTALAGAFASASTPASPTSASVPANAPAASTTTSSGASAASAGAGNAAVASAVAAANSAIASAIAGAFGGVGR